jgi:putative tryptophan/tyrosine transport system substrate-binding protein
VKRREFISLFGIGTVAWPVGARAQQPGKTYRIGWLQPSPLPDQWLNGFRHGLQEFNYIDGKNMVIEYRWGGGNVDYLSATAAEMVHQNLDVIVSTNTAALLALQKATTIIPIVMLGTADPVASGLVESLARPGGNITGMSSMAPELSTKRLELLKDVVPKLGRVTVLSNSGNPAAVQALQETRAAAQSLGLTVDSVDARAPAEIDGALSMIDTEPPGAIVLLIDAMTNSQRIPIADFAIKHRLASISPFREFTEAGGLMAYGPNNPDMLRRAGSLIDKILRGTKPADLPVQQPTKFEMIINLKIAKTLGLTVPPSLLATADEVIE